jgi:hypothetical protein
MEEEARPSKKRKVEAVRQTPVVCNVKVKYLRPEYRNLREWCDDRNNVYIGRAGVVFLDGKRFPPWQSVWANPFKIGRDGNRGQVMTKYEKYIREKIDEDPTLLVDLRELQGKNLGCWCVESPTSNCHTNLICHGQILIKILEENT